MSTGRRRPTLEKVALLAGVARATVSRVVNGSSKDRPHVPAAGLHAIRELGYVPNQAARSLVTQRTDSIALVFPEAASRVFSDDQFFHRIVQGVSREVDAAGKQLVLMVTDSGPSHDRVERYAA